MDGEAFKRRLACSVVVKIVAYDNFVSSLKCFIAILLKGL